MTTTVTIEELEEKYAAAEQASRDAEKAKYGAALDLALARAEADGLKVGQFVEYKTEKKTFRGKIERIGRSRYEFAWPNSYSVFFRLVKKDGTLGEKVIELSRRDFFPRYPEEGIAARIIEAPAGGEQA